MISLVIYAAAKVFSVKLYAIYEGIWRINDIIEKKERHTWALQVMNELVQRAPLYKSEDNGRKPRNSRPKKDEDAFSVPETLPVPDGGEISHQNKSKNHNKIENGFAQSGTEKMDNKILLAAKIGVTEMVDI